MSLRSYVIGLVLLLASLLLLAGRWGWWQTVPQASALASVRLATPLQANSAGALLADSVGLFRQAGIRVEQRPVAAGKDALDAMLAGKADLALTGDTPFIFSRMSGNDIAVLACTLQARRGLALAVREDRNIKTMSDLRGKTVGLAFGSNSAFLLDIILQNHNVPRDTVTQVNLTLDERGRHFKTGKIDAAIVLPESLTQLENEMSGQIKTFYAEDAYEFRFLLVGKSAYIQAHQAEIRRVLSALQAANRLIHNEPQMARQQLAQVLNLDDATIGKVFNPDDHVLTLDATLLLALDDQTRWAMKHDLIKSGPIPDYLEAMKYQALKTVQADAVKFVHQE
jgi:NitT/TauT family transport system substrate-binding protein